MDHWLPILLRVYLISSTDCLFTNFYNSLHNIFQQQFSKTAFHTLLTAAAIIYDRAFKRVDTQDFQIDRQAIGRQNVCLNSHIIKHNQFSILNCKCKYILFLQPGLAQYFLLLTSAWYSFYKGNINNRHSFEFLKNSFWTTNFMLFDSLID